MQIRPYLPDGLSFAEADVWTPPGVIRAGWYREKTEPSVCVPLFRRGWTRDCLSESAA